jgi:hypothetical protein
VMSKAFYVKDKAIVLQRIVLAAFNWSYSFHV